MQRRSLLSRAGVPAHCADDDLGLVGDLPREVGSAPAHGVPGLALVPGTEKFSPV